MINEAKAETRTQACEHAALVLEDGRIVLVSGGFDGIELIQAQNGSIEVQIGVEFAVVRKLAWHTHPRPTGQSDFDRLLLTQLRQKSSIVYEINGPAEGTVFTGKRVGASMRTEVVDSFSVEGRVAVEYGATGVIVIFFPFDANDPPKSGERVFIVKPDRWMRSAVIGEVKLVDRAPGFFIPNLTIDAVPRGTTLRWGTDLPTALAGLDSMAFV